MAFVAIGIQPAGLVAGARAVNADSAGEWYKKNCSMCHATDGTGSTLGKRLHTPDLRSKEVQEKKSAVLGQDIIPGKITCSLLERSWEMMRSRIWSSTSGNFMRIRPNIQNEAVTRC